METQSSEFGLAAPPFLGQPESTSLPRQTQPHSNGQLSGSSGSMVQQQEIGHTPQERVIKPREPLQSLDGSLWTQSIAHSIEQGKQQSFSQSSEFGLAAPPFLGQPESTSLSRQTRPQCDGQLSGLPGTMVQQQEIDQTPPERVMKPREPLQPLDDSWWTQSIAHSIEQAKQQGLSHQVMHDSTFWECHFCMVTVPEQFLGSHLASNKHQRYVLWSKQLVDLESQRANGEFPPWKDIKNGCAYCTVCKKPATETHISSLKHINAISYSVFASAASSPAGSSHQPGTLTQSPSSPTCAIPPFPSHWGDLDHFEWKVNACQYFCKLCWKWADDPHVWSNDHLRSFLVASCSNHKVQQCTCFCSTSTTKSHVTASTRTATC